MKPLFAGFFAGALGTVALDITTYADMALRGRSSSSAPSQTVDVLAKKTGLPLSSQGKDAHDQSTQNRESGLGALLGYVNGLGIGIVYGLLRDRKEHVSLPFASIGVGAAAMSASDIPLVALGISSPKSWGWSGWAADAIPHFIYGLVTVLAYETLINKDED